MEEFAEGGRLSPLKVKEFIPAGTLGIGVDDNVWIRKARKDGKTYWAEFLETWNYKRFKPERHRFEIGIEFKARPELDEKYGFELTYNYNAEDGRAFVLDIYDADTLLTVIKYETKDPQKFRDICIKAREDYMPNDPILKYEFSELVGKLTSAYEKGELRKEFSEETPEIPKPKFKVGAWVVRKGGTQVMTVLKQTYDDVIKTFDYDLKYVKEGTTNSIFETELELYKPNLKPNPKFEIGDYVKVVNDGQQVMSAYNEMLEYNFENANESKSVENDTEGYVVGMYFDDLYKEYRVVVKKLNSQGYLLHEFIIAEEGLELVSKALKVGDVVYVKDTTYFYPTAPDKKTKLGFSDPSFISKASEVSYTTGEIFVVGQERDLMPIYGVKIRVLLEEILVGAQGLELVAIAKDNLEKTKIQVNNPEENRIIQEYAFSLGYYWLGVDRNIVQEFDKYPAYIEFTSSSQIFSPNKKEYDQTYKKEVTLEELGLVSSKPIETPMEFVCNIDASKINSAYVGAFYSKNKERIEKLKSEFSCKILESLVYLSDYEKCGGGVNLPIQEVVEEDDLLGAIRNLK